MKDDGVVRCWGRAADLPGHDVGQMDVVGPEPVDEHGKDVVEVRAGGMYSNHFAARPSPTCTRKKNGSLSCWGMNVGDGTFLSHTSPVAICAPCPSDRAD